MFNDIYFSTLKDCASYVDKKTDVLTEAVMKKNYNAIASVESDSLLTEINETINLLRNDTNKLTARLNNLNNLSELLLQTTSDLQEIKRAGSTLGIQFRSYNHSEEQANLSFNAPVDQKRSPIKQQNDYNNPSFSNNDLISSSPSFREISKEEYQTLPSIIPLLVSFDDMNKHYQNLMDTGNLMFTSDQFSEIVQLSSSRINAFVRALVNLKRMAVVEENLTTSYKMI